MYNILLVLVVQCDFYYSKFMQKFHPKKYTYNAMYICDKIENNSIIRDIDSQRKRKKDDDNIRTNKHKHTKSSFNKTIIEYQPSANRFLCKLSCKYIQY